MAFKRKGAPSAKSLNDPEGVAQASQRSAGNVGYDITMDCYSSGVSPVNSSGQVTDRQGTQMNWPFQNFTSDNMVNPGPQKPVPSTLGNHPQTFGKIASTQRGNNQGHSTGLLG